MAPLVQTWSIRSPSWTILCLCFSGFRKQKTCEKSKEKSLWSILIVYSPKITLNTTWYGPFVVPPWIGFIAPFPLFNPLFINTGAPFWENAQSNWKHSLLNLVRLFCDRWRCQRLRLRQRDANIKIRYDAKLPNSLYLGHAWISCSTVYILFPMFMEIGFSTNFIRDLNNLL